MHENITNTNKIKIWLHIQPKLPSLGPDVVVIDKHNLKKHLLDNFSYNIVLNYYFQLDKCSTQFCLCKIEKLRNSFFTIFIGVVQVKKLQNYLENRIICPSFILEKRNPECVSM